MLKLKIEKLPTGTIPIFLLKILLAEFKAEI
jgi:hypothetical protein